MTEVDAFLDDLDRLAATAPTGDPAGFYAQLMPASAAALGAEAADHLAAPTQAGFAAPLRWPKRREDPGLLDASVLERLRVESTPRIAPAEHDGAPIVACPIEGPGGPAGALAFRLTVDAAATAERSLGLATAIAETAGRYELRRAAARVAEDETRLARIESVLVRLHAQRGLRDAAREAVEEGRRLVGCDRLTAFTPRGRGWGVAAISGVARVSRRSDAARRMSRLVGEAMLWGRPLRAPSDRADEPPHLQELVDRYCDASGVRSLVALPCHAPPDADEIDPGANVRVALLAEWFDADRNPHADALLAALARHLGVAARRDGGSLRSCFAFGRTAALLIGLALVAAAVVLSLITPATLWTPVEGRFEPVSRSRVFAPLDGVVEELLVAQADTVRAGDPLVRLASPELRLQQEEVAEAMAATRAEIAAIETAKLRAALPGSEDREDLTSLASRIASLQERLKHERRRRDLLDAQSKKLLVTSPIAGSVLSWRPEESLADRPVRRGQRLLEIAGGDQWRIELEAPDHRVGHVLRARAAGEPLNMEYVVRSDPAATHTAVVTTLAATTQAGADGEPVVRVVAAPDDAAAANPRSGLGVSAKIDCGEHSLAYVWLHEAIEAIRRRWF